MKKFIPGLLALLACSCLATGCSLDGLFGKNNNSSSESSGSTTTEYDVEGAKTTLQSKYREDVNKFDPRADYEVLNNWTYLGQTYTVTWSVSTQNNSTDTVVLTDEGDVTLVEINKLLSADVNYTLTATLTAPDGTTAKATIPTTAGKVNQYIADPITADPVADTEYKLYIYQAQEREDLYLFGGMDGYYFASTQDLESAKTVKVEANATTTDVANDFFMYYVDGEITKYLNVVPRDTDASKVNVSFTDEPVSSWVYSAEAGTMLTTTNGKTYFLGTYDYHDTFSASEYPKYKDNFKACLVTISDRAEIADSVRVTNTLGELSFGSVIAGVHTAKLPLLGELYPEAKITWSLGENTTAASINDRGNRLTTVDVSEATEITLTATVQSGNVTETKAFAITVVPDTEAGILAGVAALEKGEDFQNEVSLTGQVTKIVTEYNSEKGTITFDMKVGDQTVQGYSAKPGDGISLANLKAGDTVTITGILTHYEDTIEFEYGSLVVALQEGTGTGEQKPTYTTPQQIMDAAYALAEDASLDGTYSLTGEIVSVDDAYSSQYENITVTIKVDGVTGENTTIKCYRIKGTGADTLKKGDTITVSGEITNYKGTVEFKSGSTFSNLVPGQSAGGETGGETGGGEGSAPAENFVIPEENVAYKFYIAQAEDKAYYYVTGEMNGDYLATTTDATAAKDFYVEKQDSAYSFKIYYLNDSNEKVYLNSAVRDTTKAKPVYDGTGAVFTYGKTDLYDGYWYTTLGESDFAVGTFGSNKTLGLSFTSYYKNQTNQYPGLFVKSSEVSTLPSLGEGSESGGDGGDAPTLTTPEEIVNAAFALKSEESLPGTYTLTGVIKSIYTPYSESEHYIKVNIQIGDMADKLIQCYKLKDTDKYANDACISALKIGDTITVKGAIKNYYGTIEFDGAQVQSFAALAITDAYKYDIEVANIVVPGIVADASNAITLLTVGEEYDDFTVAWSADKAYAVVSGNTVTITQQSATEVVTLTANITCGALNKTLTYPVIVAGSTANKAVFDFKSALKPTDGAHEPLLNKEKTVDGVTLTVSDVGDYAPQINKSGYFQLYAGDSATLSVEGAEILGVIITATDTPKSVSTTTTDYSATFVEKTITISADDLSNAVSTVVLKNNQSSQYKIYTITVIYAA